jgi:hypothetical protein
MLTARSGAPVDSPNTIEIHSLAPGDDTAAFRTLNEEWITRYFTLEAKDRSVRRSTAACKSTPAFLFPLSPSMPAHTTGVACRIAPAKPR